MKLPQGELLLELAVLIKRHPSRDWMKLARMLEQEESRSQIVSFLKGLSTLGDAISKPNSLRSTEPKAKSRIKKSGRGKAANVEKLELELAQAPMSDLRELALKTGLRVSRNDSKKDLIERMVRATRLRTSIFQRKGSPTARTGKTNDYRQWARIILGRTDQNKTGK